jgi:hypothetical protein
MNPTKHVVIALGLTAILFIIAGDSWNERIAKVQPVMPAPKVK